MEEQETQSDKYTFSTNHYNEFKEESDKLEFSKRKEENSTKNIETLLFEVKEDATGISKESPEQVKRIKSRVYNVLKKIGPDLYNREIKKKISENNKTINQLEKTQNSLEKILHQSGEGLISQKNRLRKSITSNMSIIQKGTLAEKELEKSLYEIDEKIEYASEKDDFDSLEVLRERRDNIIIDKENIQDKIESHKKSFYELVDNLKLIEQDIDEKKYLKNKINTNITYQKNEVKIYSKLIGLGKEVANYFEINQVLNKSNKQIQEIDTINKQTEEKTHFAKSKIFEETKSYNSEKATNFVREEERKLILKSKQENKNDLSQITEVYSQIMKS